MPRYFACNSYCDFEVGRVLAQIDAQIPGALVVYTSDHGEMFGAHRLAGNVIRYPGALMPRAAIAMH